MKHLKLSIIASSLAFLTACGGSSSNTSTPVTPTPATNNPPSVDLGDNVTAITQLPVNLAATTADNDGTVVLYQWSQTGGTSAEFTATNSAELSFTAPQVSEQQILTFSLTVTDSGGATASDSVDVIVEPNTAPTVVASDNITVIGGNNVELSATGSDTETTTLTYAWAQTSGDAVELSATDSREISFAAPLLEQQQTLTFTVTVTDFHGATTTDSVDVVVQSNTPPTVIASDDISVIEGATVGLSVTASDLESTELTYAWTQTSGEAVELSATDSNELSFVAPLTAEQQVLSFSVAVTDHHGNISSDSVDVTITPTAKIADLSFTSEDLANCVNNSASENNWQRIIQMTSLECNSSYITTIAGIEQLSYITELSLSNNWFNDITPALQLSLLTSLNASSNWLPKSEIDEITAIKTWTELSLSNLEVHSLTGFSGLTELVKLDLSGNVLNDLSPLSDATKLESLYLDSTGITDIEFLDNFPNLHALSINNTLVRDISKITSNNHWTELGLDNLNLTDIGFLEEMTSLTSLVLSENKISDISVIENLQQLEILMLNDIGTVDLEPIANLPNLIQLSLYSNDINFDDNLSHLSGMTQLQWLNVGRTDINDLSVLSTLTELQYLGIYSIADLQNGDTLTNLNQLSSLYILVRGSQQHQDTSFISELTSLKRLNYIAFNNQPIPDMSKLTNLEFTFLYPSNRDYDLNHLTNNTKLKSLSIHTYVRSNNFAALAGLQNLKHLQVGVGTNADISEIGKLKNLRAINIEPMDYSKQQPADLNFLTELPKLMNLSVAQSYFDFNPIADSLTQLRALDISFAQFNSASLAKLTKLSSLDAYDIGFKNDLFLAQMPQLQSLALGGSEIRFDNIAQLRQLNYLTLSTDNLNSLSGLTNLISFYSFNKNPGSLEPLANLTQLRNIRLHNMDIADISALANLTNLTSLDIDSNNISDLTPLSDMHFLTYLSVTNNQLTSLNGLSNATNLWYLNANSNQIEDISALSTLSYLQDLYLGYNNLSNVEPLFNLDALIQLNLFGNENISCEDRTRLIIRFSDINFYHDTERYCE